MCYIFSTSHVACRHKQYQNTFACSIARGIESHLDCTLEKTVFLPDTANPPPHPLSGDSKGPCQKRYPVRTVNGYCNTCKRSNTKKTASGKGDQAVTSDEGYEMAQTPGEMIRQIESDLGDLSS
ncbi:hypothetical protein QBC33DRAFT_554381 [Phialemonium atrogriseum]|uniref:Uncharacterized protein n=1 Tax=Phialemonium atrogriseum TaxID=1093897 RepID=A0AAJ0CEP3_9PEZI|nr:uncharacterized protein QBC33DRAFT_554381 [Phialemonium atrogriseum]KAK1772941.1 hypothetical protein QBC33DRAFT_554381 [Phialemonium atrogriseum]